MGRRMGENAPRFPQLDEKFFCWFVFPSTPKKIMPMAKGKRIPFGKVCGCLEGLSLDELGSAVMLSSSIGWIGGGYSSMDVTTFSGPSAPNLRVHTSVKR